MAQKKLLIALPAYNEEKAIGKVLENLPKKVKGIDKIEALVINDGSTDKTEEIALQKGALVISHPLNLGCGCAVQTIFSYFRKRDFDFLVLLDADGQHDPAYIEKLVMPLINKEAEVTIGVRQFQLNNTPLLRILGNFLLSKLTHLFYGVKFTDSQSGFRAFSKEAVKKIDLRSFGIEIATEINLEIASKKIPFLEIKIPSIYTKYSQKKGQSIFNGLNQIFQIFMLPHRKR